MSQRASILAPRAPSCVALHASLYCLIAGRPLLAPASCTKHVSPPRVILPASSRLLSGKVAEKIPRWQRSPSSSWQMPFTSFARHGSLRSISRSASSKTMVRTAQGSIEALRRTPRPSTLSVMSPRMRPGVPTSTSTPSRSAPRSCPMDRPPLPTLT